MPTVAATAPSPRISAPRRRISVDLNGLDVSSLLQAQPDRPRRPCPRYRDLGPDLRPVGPEAIRLEWQRVFGDEEQYPLVVGPGVIRIAELGHELQRKI